MIGAAAGPAAEEAAASEHGPPPGIDREESNVRRPANAPARPAPVVAEVEAREIAPTPQAAPLPAPGATPPASPAPSRPAQAAGGVSAEHQQHWSRVVQSGMTQSPVLRTVLMNTILVSFSADGGVRRAVLCVNERFASGAIKQRERITELFQRECGGPVEVEFQDTNARAAGKGTPAATDPEADAQGGGGAAPPHAAPARPDAVQIGEHPLVKHALEVFGAKIVDVQQRRH